MPIIAVQGYGRINVKIITWFGTLELDDSEQLVDCEILDSKDIDHLAGRLRELQQEKNDMVPVGYELRDAAQEYGFVSTDEEYVALLHQVSIQAAKYGVAESYTPDMRIVQAIGALDDIDEAANLLSERLSEWYGLHFPELDKNTEQLANFVATHGSRSTLPAEDALFEKARSSMGADLSYADETLLKSFAQNISALYEDRHRIEDYIIESMGQLSPNLSDIAGPLIGARLISMTGGLPRLARLPSSTVQVMGANRALFKHLRSRAPSPKHGVIFNHPLIKNAPWWQRGKIARVVAAKISLASRIDLYSGRVEPSLKDDLMTRIASIEAAHPNPPARSTGKNKGGRR